MDNIGNPEDSLAAIKRRMKSLEKTNRANNTKIRKLQGHLARIIPLAKQVLTHVSPGHDDRAELSMEVQASEAELRDQGVDL